jgi:hypothetical protein
VEAHRVVRRQGSHILDNPLTDDGDIEPYGPVAFYPQENPWYSFLLEAEFTPGP